MAERRLKDGLVAFFSCSPLLFPSPGRVDYIMPSTKQDLPYLLVVTMVLCPCRKSFHTVLSSYLSFQQSHLTSQIFFLFFFFFFVAAAAAAAAVAVEEEEAAIEEGNTLKRCWMNLQNHFPSHFARPMELLADFQNIWPIQLQSLPCVSNIYTNRRTAIGDVQTFKKMKYDQKNQKKLK